jgi:hypothetical protein
MNITLTLTETRFRIADHGAIILTFITFGHTLIVNCLHCSLLVSGSCVAVVADFVCVFAVVGIFVVHRFHILTSLCHLFLACSACCNEGGGGVASGAVFPVAVGAVADIVVDVCSDRRWRLSLYHSNKSFLRLGRALSSWFL